MNHPNHLEYVIEAFRSKPLRRGLYDLVSSESTLVFSSSSDDYWYSTTRDKRTEVFWGKSANEEACLCHELLHAKLKIGGYKQYTVSYCGDGKGQMLKRVLEILDNELQHHKFYQEFLSLGFKPEEMYGVPDAGMPEQIRTTVGSLSGRQEPIEMYFNSYVTVIAPGGPETPEEREQLFRFFEEHCPRRYMRRLEVVRNSMESFASSETLDAGPFIIQALRALEYEHSWVGTETKFPEAGLFTGAPFNI